MKKIILFLGIVTSFLIACGGNNNEAQKTDETIANSSASNNNSAKSGGELLIVKSDCIGCHNQDTKMIGPSYLEIAEKYSPTDENIAYLADKIIKGGKGVWGNIPMTPHPKLSVNDAKTMAKYILSLKK